ncbi:MAG: hypothetical protein HRU22_11030 [Gammaproteobacteria bacterium]|nr:hypothetical protein [Gammaproteobacteria bacterium]
MVIKTSDFFHLVVTALTLVGWGVLLWSLLLFHEARPEMSTLLTKIHQIEVRQHWLAIVYDKIMLLLWFCAGISFVAIFGNWYVRRTDQQSGWVAQVLLFTVAAVAIAVLTIWQPLME